VIHFVLSREAPYAADAPFPATLLASSPTFHSAAMIKLLHSFRPDVVIFDNAGRTAQLRAAREVNARVVYISARRRQRRKAFRWRWLRLIDEHWIAYPEFIAGPLNLIEKLKLRVGHRPRVRYLDVIVPRANSVLREVILSRAGRAPGTFVLLVPGGGTGHPGADDAAGRFAAAARTLGASGVATVCVGPGAGNGFDSLPLADLAELMRSARLVVANGGSTLLQAIACGAAVVAAPIAGDQLERARRCVAAGVAVAADLNAASIVDAVNALLKDDAKRAGLAGRAARLDLADGIEVAVLALGRLVGPPTALGT